MIGVSYDADQAAMDRDMLRARSWRYAPAADLRVSDAASRLAQGYHRLRNRLGRLRSACGWPDPAALGYAVGSLSKAALRENADLTILHLEPALWAGTRLIRRGMRIGVDIEDWYSENRPAGPAARRESRYLRGLEQRILRAAAYATCPSRAMAEALSKAYQVPLPEVVYNSVPSLRKTVPVAPGGPLRLVWFSQTIGPGRGLEDLFPAIGCLNSAASPLRRFENG